MVGLKVTSPAFRDGDMLPVQFTCDGDGISPPVEWSGVPARTESLVLLCEDPDAADSPFIHWVLYNLPAHTTALPEGMPHDATLPTGGQQGMNSALSLGYVPPCPPQEQLHRYEFKVYALDSKLELPEHPTRDQVVQAMSWRMLAGGRLVARYRRAQDAVA